MNKNKIPLVVVLGPTASGKTRLAIDIAKKLESEIISADSMQVYKLMDIGTAKPTKEEQAKVKHHLIDVVMPNEEFNVYTYTNLAKEKILEIHNQNKIPIMAGGTGLYIDSVCNNIEFTKTKTDNDLRESLKEYAKVSGSASLHKHLSTFDPQAAKRIHPNDLFRIIRAIEVYKTSGITITEHQKRSKLKQSPYNVIKFMINWDRDKLYKRIEDRVDLMLRDGLVDEVKDLLLKGYTKDLTSMQGLGYKEIIDYILGHTTLEKATLILKQNTRRYAKRQLTWFRRDKSIIRLLAEDKDIKDIALRHIYNLYKST